MPAVSKKQQRFFGYLLSNPEERKKKGISKKDATDFAQHVKEGEIADKLRKVVADMKAADRKAGLLPGGKDVIDLDVEREIIITNLPPASVSSQEKLGVAVKVGS